MSVRRRAAMDEYVTYEEVRELLRAHGQLHVLRFWPELDADERRSLLADVKSLDVASAAAMWRRWSDASASSKTASSRLEAVPAHCHGSKMASSASELRAYMEEGLRLVAEGRVAVLLLAGGQGTRLGVSYPKGMYDVGLPSSKSLYQLQAERLRKLQQLAGCSGDAGAVVWYIMTSEATMEATRLYLSRHRYFGLRPDAVVLFEQGVLPCFHLDGRLVLETRSRVAKAPDGNGGIFQALRDQGVLADMEARGVRYVHVHSVDNVLVQVADPLFVGFCALRRAECAAKVVDKRSPSEAVGVVCHVDGRFRVVEYTEIPRETAETVDGEGRLVLRAGNICNHLFTTAFLRRVVDTCLHLLPLHVATKKIPYVDLEDGRRRVPDAPNGVKMEKFVFDVFPFADSFATWQVQREEEFSPVKNAEGDGTAKDSPATARRDLYALHCRYVRDAGGEVTSAKGCPPVCEISPLLSYAGEGLEDLVRGAVLANPVHLRHPSEEEEEVCDRPLANGNSH